MGADPGDGSKFRRDAASSKAHAGHPAPVASSGAAPGDLIAFRRRVRSQQGRVNLVAEIAFRALDKNDPPAETEQRNLALALRAISVAAELKRAADLPRQIKGLKATLERDREDRARMESGVEFADEGAQLPPVGGDECH